VKTAILREQEKIQIEDIAPPRRPVYS